MMDQFHLREEVLLHDIGEKVFIIFGKDAFDQDKWVVEAVSFIIVYNLCELPTIVSSN